MDKPRIYRPKRLMKVLGVLMMVAGFGIFWTDENVIPHAAYIGFALLAVGAFISTDLRIMPPGSPVD